MSPVEYFTMLARILLNYRTFMRNSKLSLNDLRCLQDAKTRQLIRYVYENVPFYHKLLRSRDLTPESFQGMNELNLLPILTRQDVARVAQTEFVPPNAKVGITMRTSGTSGIPLSVALSRRFCDVMMGLSMRSNWLNGVRPWNKAVWVPYFGSNGPKRSGGDSHGSSSFLRVAYKVLFGTVITRFPVIRQKTLGITNDNIKELALMLHEMEPDIIRSRPSYLRRIAHLLNDQGFQLCPKKVFVEGETLSDGCRKDLENMYATDVINSYGSNEFGLLGFECSAHSGIHLNSDCFIYEVLRDGKPVSAGERGELFVTCLENEAMPLIRYKLGDTVVLGEEEECECGINLPRLESVEGRLNDGLLSKEGKRIPPGSVVNYIESVLGLKDYQITQSARNQVTIKVTKTVTARTSEMLSSYLEDLLGEDLVTNVVDWNVEEMPPKYRPVVCEVKDN